MDTTTNPQPSRNFLTWLNSQKLGILLGFLLGAILVGSGAVAYKLIRAYVPSQATASDTPPTVDSPPPVSGTDTSGQSSDEPSIDMEFQVEGNTKLVQEAVEPGATTTRLIVVRSANLGGSDCYFTTKHTSPSGTVTSETEAWLLTHPSGGRGVTMKEGSYEFKVECIQNGKTYTSVIMAEITQTAASICDTRTFELGEILNNFEEAKTKIVGTWRGCFDAPFGSEPNARWRYQVEFTFNADGTYTARNYEVVVNPTTTRRNPATYYGTDNDAQKYELTDMLMSGKLIGNLYLGADYKVDWRSISISTDGTKLYFEMREFPIIYTLERI